MAMQKFTVRNGDRFSWGWLPPVEARLAGLMEVLDVAANAPLPGAQTFPASEPALGVWLLAFAG